MLSSIPSLNVGFAANRKQRVDGSALNSVRNGTNSNKLIVDIQLTSIAERALLLTHGDGAAIALRAGQTIVCRAAAGALAPPIGVKINPQSGISGACLRLGRLLMCNSTDSDPHVDRECCRSLGISSVIAAPIRNAGSTVGLIEVFSREPNAFDESDCYGIERLAESIVVAIASKSLHQSEIEPPLGTSQRYGTPWYPTEGAPTSSTNSSATAGVPSSIGPTVVEAAVVSPRFANPGVRGSYKSRIVARLTGETRAALWIAVAIPLLVVTLLPNLGTRVRSSPHLTTSDAKQTERNLSPRISSVPRFPTVHVHSDYTEELRRKAESGDAGAQFQVGVQYANSEGKENNAQAIKWFTTSAENGNAMAAATLGAFYWAGRGVAQEYVTAYMWSAIAKEEGDEASAYRLPILRSRLSTTQLTQAELLAAAWLRPHHKQRVPKENASIH